MADTTEFWEVGAQGMGGAGVPAGGTTGQVLKKVSDADRDTGWADETGGGGSPAWGAIGGTLTSQADLVAYVAAQISAAVTGLLDFKGGLNASTNPNYPAASKGDAYVTTVAGKVGGASGKAVDVGDFVIATADNAGGPEASVGASWAVLEHNLPALATVATTGSAADLVAGTLPDARLPAIATPGTYASPTSLTIDAQGRTTAVGGASPYDYPPLDPTQTTLTCKYWLRPALLALADGTAVTNATDSGGAGNTFTASGTAKPLYRTSGINGRPALQFDGVDDELVNDAIAADFSNVSVVLCCVVQLTDLLTPQYFLTLADPTGFLATLDFYVRLASGSFWSDFRDDNNVEISAGGGRPVAGVPLVLWVQHNYATGDTQFWVNNVLAGHWTTGTGPFTPTQLTLMAHRRGGLNDGQVKGYVGDVAVFIGDPTAADRAGVTKRFANEYGIALGTVAQDDPTLIPGVVAAYRPASIDPLYTSGENTTATWSCSNTNAYDLTPTGGGLKYGYHGRNKVLRVGGNYIPLTSAQCAALGGTAQPFTRYATARWFDTSAVHVLWSMSDGTGGGSYAKCQVETDGRITVEQRNNAGSVVTRTSKAKLDSAFHHVVVVFDGVTVVVYVDGKVWVNDTWAGGACTFSTGAVGALLRAAASLQWYDEVGAFGSFPRALTFSEVARLKTILDQDLPTVAPHSLVSGLRASAGTYSDVAAQTLVTADGSDVLNWVGTNGFSFKTVNGATTKAILKTAQVNGKPVVRFANSALTAAVLATFLRGRSAAMLTLTNKVPTAETGIQMSWANSGGGGYSYSRLRDSNNSPAGATVLLASVGGTALVEPTDPGAGFVTRAIGRDGGTLYSWRNGVLVATHAVDGTAPDALDLFTLGSLVYSANATGSGFYAASLDVAGLDLRDYFDPALTDSAAQALEFATY